MKTDRRLKQACRELYFKWRTTEEIVNQTGVKKSTLSKWIYGTKKNDPKAWQVERAIDSQRFIRESVEVNSQKAHGVVRLGFAMIENALIARVKQKDKEGKSIPLSMKEAKYVKDIVVDIDKLMRLAEGEPTEIYEARSDVQVSQKPITIVELRNAFKNDPFMQVEIPMKERENARTRATEKEETTRGDQEITDADLESTGIQIGASGDSEESDDSDGFGNESTSEFDESDDSGG